MKVLILSNHELTLINFRQELLHEMKAMGYDVIIAMPSGANHPFFEKLGCKMIPMNLSQHGMNPFRDFCLPWQYQRIIRLSQPDVVLTYTIKPNIYGGLAAGICDAPCVSTVTGLGAAFEKGPLTKRIAFALYRIGTRKTRCLFFQNPGHSALFLQRGIAAGRHRLVSGSGVNLLKHCFEPYPEDGEIRLLFVGRITKEKGIGELISSMRLVRGKTKRPVALALLGNVEKGYEGIVAAAEKEGLLVSLGRHDNVHDYIKESHAVVLPSYHEGLANALLEAQAAGRPVIATKIHGCIEAFEEGVTGIGCRARDARDLADCIVRFVNLPHGEKAEMGRKAREKMEREYDRNAVNQIYFDVIASIGNESKGRAPARLRKLSDDGG